jgi:Lrp/AsnC family leucine-responsive transcriptional regulator
MGCHHIAGHFDYLIKISTADMHYYQDFLVNKLAKMENIGNVQSSFVLKEIKNTTKVDI